MSARIAALVTAVKMQLSAAPRAKKRHFPLLKRRKVALCDVMSCAKFVIS